MNEETIPADVRKRILVKGFEYGALGPEDRLAHIRQDSYIHGAIGEYLLQQGNLNEKTIALEIMSKGFDAAKAAIMAQGDEMELKKAILSFSDLVIEQQAIIAKLYDEKAKNQLK